MQKRQRAGLRFQDPAAVVFAGSLVAVLVIFSILDPRFMSVGNIINISRQMSINMIIAVGMTFCMISGGFDLSVGSIGAMAGCITGL